MGFQDSKEDLTSSHSPIIVKVFSGASLGLFVWLANGRQEGTFIPFALGGAAMGLVFGIFHSTRNAVRDRGSVSPGMQWATESTRMVAVAIEREVGAVQLMAMANDSLAHSPPQPLETELPMDFPARALSAEDDKLAVIAVELTDDEKRIQLVAQSIRSAAFGRKITPEAGSLFPFGEEFYHGVYWYQIAEFWYQMNQVRRQKNMSR